MSYGILLHELPVVVYCSTKSITMEGQWRIPYFTRYFVNPYSVLHDRSWSWNCFTVGTSHVYITKTWPKFILDQKSLEKKVISYELCILGSPNLVRALTSYALYSQCSLHSAYTACTLQVHSSSGRAMTKAGGLTSKSSCIFFILISCMAWHLMGTIIISLLV